MVTWQLWLRGRAGGSDRPAPPVRTRSGGLTPPGSPAPHPASVEPRLRRLVADELGVDPNELAPAISLSDDLAADSLDLLGLVLATEAEFEVAVPDAALATVRTYGDLVATVTRLVDRRRPAPLAGEPAPVRARVVPAGAGRRIAVERAEWLTPYVAQTIAEDALAAGPGARLEVDVPSGLSDAALALVEDRFARLGPRGVDVQVRRCAGSTDGRPGAVVARTGS